MSVDRVAVAAWVAASCQAQGVPVAVSDPEVVRRVVTLLGGPVGGGRAQGAAAPSATSRAGAS